MRVNTAAHRTTQNPHPDIAIELLPAAGICADDRDDGPDIALSTASATRGGEKTRFTQLLLVNLHHKIKTSINFI
jgi:hypothetical protein